MPRVSNLGLICLLAIGPASLQATSTSATTPGISASDIISGPADAADLPRALAPLAWFLGQWHCQGRFPNGTPISSRETFTTTLGGHWIRMKHHDLPPHKYDAVEWWGHDRASKHFVVDIHDNGGGVRHYTSSGWNGDTLSLENTATKGYVDRFVFRRLGDSRYQVAYDHKRAAGPWKRGDVLTCNRARSSSTHP